MTPSKGTPEAPTPLVIVGGGEVDVEIIPDATKRNPQPRKILIKGGGVNGDARRLTLHCPIDDLDEDGDLMSAVFAIFENPALVDITDDSLTFEGFLTSFQTYDITTKQHTVVVDSPIKATLLIDRTREED